MMQVYTLVANTMERLGIQPIRAEERRQSLGRRFQDSGKQFLIDHLILTAIEACGAVLVYSFFAGGGQ